MITCMAHPLSKEANQVFFEKSLGSRKVILNRPRKLNSLNHETIVQMLRKLQEYENDDTVKLVILKGNGKAFCAGGDVIAAIQFSTAGHWSFAASFYTKQFQLDYLLGTYNKPLVALLDGIVMGGGAGISMHATFRIVTEKTIFAMPEASIGLLPDVGASHFLSRLPGFFGEYVGLTGARLDGTEMLACGLATHFIHSKDLISLENNLNLVASTQVINSSTISSIIDKFAERVQIKRDSAFTRLEIIDKCFSRDTVEEILSSLESIAMDLEEKWVDDAIRSMKSASPLSLKLFLRSIRQGRSQKLEQCLTHEFNVICHIFRRTVNDDFYEGSRAMLIDKDKRPKWGVSKLELVSEEMVETCFGPVIDEDWEPLHLPARSNKECPMTLSSRL